MQTYTYETNGLVLRTSLALLISPQSIYHIAWVAINPMRTKTRPCWLLGTTAM